ncbi:MAG: hypothetical protein GC159_12715 [Phycisphaera sp.]|nr:hypothetical protein [Phycisphaera sp.]
MPKRIDKFSRTRRERSSRGHRFEHWYVDNQVYFITARCRDRFPALAADEAKSIFWARFEHYTAQAAFEPWVVSVLDNHYHALGYNTSGDAIKSMMQRLHGSVAKLVNDLLPERRDDFWRDDLGKEYFDGCIRDEAQCRLAWAYTLRQGQRHGYVADYRDYPHTRVYADLNDRVRWALAHDAFMPNVPYPRYQRPRNK